MILRRLPVESPGPIVVFAATRVGLSVFALVAVMVLGFPYEGRAAPVLLAFTAWAAAVLVLARRNPQASLHPAVAAGDFALLVLLEVLVPETLGAVRLASLFLVAAHAHFQGERRGIAVAAIGSGALVLATNLRGDEPVTGDVLAFYEVVYVLSSLATALLVGTLRTAESASRLRARSLSRRTIQAESEVRRRVAESIHDGPVQELIGLDMILSAAAQAARSGRGDESADLIAEARDLATRNIRALRDEIVDLGPYAFHELSFATAIENCLPVWQRRYSCEVGVMLEQIDLPSEVAGDLFRIAQEAVVNAGRHSGADAVSLSLRTVDGEVELRVADNGHGFLGSDPLAGSEPGHLGLASMRERAELIGGRIYIDSSERGTRVLVRAPLAPPAA